MGKGGGDSNRKEKGRTDEEKGEDKEGHYKLEVDLTQPISFQLQSGFRWWPASFCHGFTRV